MANLYLFYVFTNNITFLSIPCSHSYALGNGPKFKSWAHIQIFAFGTKLFVILILFSKSTKTFHKVQLLLSKKEMAIYWPKVVDYILNGKD